MYYSRENLTVFKHNLELSWNADFFACELKIMYCKCKIRFKKNPSISARVLFAFLQS